MTKPNKYARKPRLEEIKKAWQEHATAFKEGALSMYAFWLQGEEPPEGFDCATFSISRLLLSFPDINPNIKNLPFSEITAEELAAYVELIAASEEEKPPRFWVSVYPEPAATLPIRYAFAIFAAEASLYWQRSRLPFSEIPWIDMIVGRQTRLVKSSDAHNASFQTEEIEALLKEHTPQALKNIANQIDIQTWRPHWQAEAAEMLGQKYERFSLH